MTTCRSADASWAPSLTTANPGLVVNDLDPLAPFLTLKETHWLQTESGFLFLRSPFEVSLHVLYLWAANLPY